MYTLTWLRCRKPFELLFDFRIIAPMIHYQTHLECVCVADKPHVVLQIAHDRLLTFHVGKSR